MYNYLIKVLLFIKKCLEYLPKNKGNLHLQIRPCIHKYNLVKFILICGQYKHVVDNKKKYTLFNPGKKILHLLHY